MTVKTSGSYCLPHRLERLAVPERISALGMTLREAERGLEAAQYSGELVDLTYANTHRFPPPEWVLPDFCHAANSGMTYTPYRGDRGVREKLAPAVGRFLGVPVDPDTELVLTPGTQAALYEALASLVEEDDTVLLLDPDYITNERILRYLGANVVQIPLLWEGGDGALTLDFDAFQRALEGRPRLFLFSHPNNPTGSVFEHHTVARIADLASEHDLLVVVDELYSRLIYDGSTFSHLVSLPGMKERCVTLIGPSKTESMSGYRVGAAVAPPEIANRMEDVQSVTSLRAPAYAQGAVVRWLDEDKDYVANRTTEYQALRDVTVNRIAQTDVLEVVPARGTSYMFPRFNLDVNDQQIALALKVKAGILVNPGYQFGPRGLQHFRICFAQDEKEWVEVLDRLIGTLEALS